MKSLAIMTSAIAFGMMAGTSAAQTTQTDQGQSRQQERVGAILGSLFGERLGSASIEAQWAAGRTPLANQRAQFETNVDTEARAGTLTQATSTRLKNDYSELVQTEARYGADRRFTTQERTDLADRYGRLTQAFTDKKYGDEVASGDVAKGKTEFDRRVDAGISARRLSRVEATRLKSDYAALIDTESNYLGDSTLSKREQDDLDSRLDALDTRVGDTSYAANVKNPTSRSRLDAIASALPTSGLGSAAKTQLQIEHGDLSRLEAAYSRVSPSTDDQAYLDRRLTNLEGRARVRR